MIKVSNVQTMGWAAAIRGMRNPMNSWDKIDSYAGYDCSACGIIDREGSCKPKDHDCGPYFGYEVGPNDLGLMKRLAEAGREHRKYMRMIHVQMDILAPLYWWKEFDTYKVGTTANSCSTMHKLTAKKFELEDFSTDWITFSSMDSIKRTISDLNDLRDRYLYTKDKTLWYTMVQLLPSSYNQRRTVDFDYETALTMIFQREGHKLQEWRDFTSVLKKLPHMEDLMED